MDILGVCVLGVTTAVGGGIIRDIILGNTPPQAFDTPVYIVTAIVVSALVSLPGIRKLIHNEQARFDRMLLVMDSLGLSIFTVVGIEVAYHTSDNVFLLVFVGALTGVGGRSAQRYSCRADAVYSRQTLLLYGGDYRCGSDDHPVEASRLFGGNVCRGCWNICS